MKIYLSGKVKGSYRGQNIIKVLSDNEIPFVILPSPFFIPKISCRWVELSVGFFSFLFSLPFRLFLISIATHLIVLPMNKSAIVLVEIIWAFLLRKHLIVDYYISAFDTSVNDRRTVKRGSVKAYWALFNDWLLLKIANNVIFLNRAESKYYQKVAGVELAYEKCTIIPLCVDYKREKFISENSEVEKNIGDTLKVCWWGTYIPLHGLESIIKAFSLISDEDIELYLFGDSDVRATPYRLLVEKMGLSDKVFIENNLSFVNGKLAPFLINNCDLALGNFGTSEKAKTVLVNKVVDSLALGIPCLTMETKAITELFDDKEGIIFCDAKPVNLAKKISALSSDKSELKMIGARGFNVFLQNFSPESFRSRFFQNLKKTRSKT